jgi:hypothetical protein
VPLDLDPIRALEDVWQTAPLIFEGTWLDSLDVNLELDAIGDFLKAQPSERIFVRETGEGPGAPHRMVQLDSRPLSAQLSDRVLHITALDLQELDPRFQSMIDCFVERLDPILGRTDKSQLQVTAGLFIASGKTFVPFHVDFEHNFLIQLLGEKEMHIFPRDVPEIFMEEARERLAKDMADSRFLPYSEDFERYARIMKLRPGTSTYQPPMSPHWVVSDSGVTMSLLLSLFSSEELKLRLTHFANAILRGFGFHPAPVGRHPLTDDLKYRAMMLARETKRRLKPIRYSRGRMIDVRKKKLVN